jgi:predicted ATPase/DNA-binding SARP family transcriptional activator
MLDLPRKQRTCVFIIARRDDRKRSALEGKSFRAGKCRSSHSPSLTEPGTPPMQLTRRETASAAGAAPLTISLFGPMQVLVRGAPLPRLRSRKGLWLLALLVRRQGRPVEREWLAGTLWPDADPSAAFANLRPVCSELRRALGPEGERLQSPNRQTLLLDLAGAAADVLAFDMAIRRRDPAFLEEAVALYQGPLLEGCEEEWVGQERVSRERQCIDALVMLGEQAAALSDPRDAGRYYQRALDLDPYHESARRGLMEALANSGDLNAALQVYRSLVELLRDDPLAAPDEQTTALYQRLRNAARRAAAGEPRRQRSRGAGGQGSRGAGEQRGRYPLLPCPSAPLLPCSSAPPPHLPAPLTGLVDREDERADVGLRLRRSRLVTLTGAGGIGKTRLALAVAAEVASEYPGGAWFVALDPLTDGRLVAQHLAAVLGVREQPGRSLLESVADRLRTARALLVFDNCEHLLDALAPVVERLLRECAGVRVLATSRESLGITGEVAWPVPPLAAPEPEHLPPGRAALLRVLLGYDSVQLFVQRAQTVQPAFEVTAGNARTVGRICSQLDGIPLAIELAAARTRALSVDQIDAHLLGHSGLMAIGSRTAVARQQTLRATLDWSYALLTEPERLLLRRLSVFAGGWTLEAAEAVCGEDRVGVETCGRVGVVESESRPHAHTSIRPHDILDLLTSLVDKSLVVYSPPAGSGSEGSGRYRLLEMVRQYAAEVLARSGARDHMRARHRDWYLALAEAAESRLRGAEQESWLRRLDAEYDNLRSALAWSLSRDEGRRMRDESGQEPEPTHPSSLIPHPSDAALRLAGALGRYWEIRGFLTEGRRYLAEALEREAPVRRTPERARALDRAGRLALRQGDYADARSRAEESLSTWRAMGNQRGTAESLNLLGNIASAQGDYPAARALYEESLAIQRQLGDRSGCAVALNNLATAVIGQGDYVLGRALLEESLEIKRELGDQRGIAYSLSNLAGLASDLGDWVVARPLHEEGLAIRRELGDRWGIANSLRNLGHVVSNQGDLDTARALLEESLQIRRELGDRRGIAHSLGILADIVQDQDDPVSAQSLYAESLAIHREVGDRGGVAERLEGLAALMLVQAKAQKAVRLWGAAHALRERIGSPKPLHAREKYDQQLAEARSALGEEAFAAAWEAGCALTWEGAVDYALKKAEWPE